MFIVVIRDPDAVRRPAARPFVQDAQSAVRRTYRQSHGTLGVLNEWPSCWSTDSVGVSYNCDKHDSDLLTHAVHSAPCSNLYSATVTNSSLLSNNNRPRLELHHCHLYVQSIKHSSMVTGECSLHTKHYNTSCYELVTVVLIVNDVQSASIYL